MYKSIFSPISTKQITSEAYEGIKVILKHPDGNTIRVVIIYRQPASSIDALLDDLSNVLYYLNVQVIKMIKLLPVISISIVTNALGTLAMLWTY